MLAINLEAREQFLPLTELIKRYISSSDNVFNPPTSDYKETIYRLISEYEIQKKITRHENIKEIFKVDEASGLLVVNNKDGNKIVLLDDLIPWAEEKDIDLTQDKIRNRKTYLELADERIQQRQYENALPSIAEVKVLKLQAAQASEPVTPAAVPTLPPAALPNIGEATIRRKLRTNSLDVAIIKAIQQAASLDTGAVYLQLREMALSGEVPFSGAVEGNALRYTNDKNQSAKLSKPNLGKRLKNYTLHSLSGRGAHLSASKSG